MAMIPQDVEATVLEAFWQHLRDTQTRAATLGAVWHEDGCDRFILRSDELAMLVTVYPDRTQVELHTASRGRFVFAVDANAVYYSEDTPDEYPTDLLLPTLDVQLPVLAIMPPLNALYGFVGDDGIVGLMYTSALAEAFESEDEVGLEPTVFWLFNPADYDFFNHGMSVVAWTERFWKLVIARRAIPLGARLAAFSDGLWLYGEGTQRWLRFHESDNRHPAWATNMSYWRWDIATNRAAALDRLDGFAEPITERFRPR